MPKIQSLGMVVQSFFSTCDVETEHLEIQGQILAT